MLSLGELGALGRRCIANVNELQQPRLAKQLDGRRFIFEARQLHHDPPLALELNDRLGHTEGVDALINDRFCRFHRLRRHCLALGRIGFQQHLNTTLQIKALHHAHVTRDDR